MLGHGLWERRFNRDPAIVGTALVINDEPHTVVGVLPASFDFATIFAPGSQFDLYFPFPLSPETNRWGNTMAMIGRLKPGVTAAGRRPRSARWRSRSRANTRSATASKGTSGRCPSRSAATSGSPCGCSPARSGWSC